MSIGLVGRKCGMTRVFTDAGETVPVTVIEALPNRITQVKGADSDGYRALQVTTGNRRQSLLNKPAAGHFAKANVAAGKGLWEMRLSEKEGADLKAGAELKVDQFKVGQIVDVTGTTIGKGFAGVMMQPKRTKFRKQFKGRNPGYANRGSTVAFGEYGLKATSRGRMTAREIEAARRAVSRYVKRGGQIWLRVFPDVPVTQKPLEVRMGSGKGNVEYYVAKVKPGKVLFEMEGVTEAIAREAFRLAASKLSVDTQFVARQVR